MRRNNGYGRSLIEITIHEHLPAQLCLYCGAKLTTKFVHFDDSRFGYLGDFDSVACILAYVYDTYFTHYTELLWLIHKQYPNEELIRAPPRTRFVTYGGNIEAAISTATSEEAYRYPLQPVTMLYLEKRVEDVISLTHQGVSAMDTSTTTSTTTTTSTMMAVPSSSRKRKTPSTPARVVNPLLSQLAAKQRAEAKKKMESH